MKTLNDDRGRVDREFPGVLRVTVQRWHDISPIYQKTRNINTFPSYVSYRYRIGKKNGLILYRYCIGQRKEKFDVSGFSDILSFLIYRKE